VPDELQQVLDGYAGKANYSLDAFTVLVAAPGAKNQTLHADVPLMRRKLLSVLTALDDVTADMGPTFFCPCSGMASQWAAQDAASIAISSLTQEAGEICMGSSYAPDVLPKGTVTVYDSATFHKGLENLSEKPRNVLALELVIGGRRPRRAHVSITSDAAQKQTAIFRAKFLPGLEAAPAEVVHEEL